MIDFLKNHPFAVQAFFDSSVVLTFAVPKEQLNHLIPDSLQLDIFEDRWAFIAIAMVQTRGLKPRVLPAAFGSDFFLVGYRIFVRYKNKAGKVLRGLYILKSETDKKRMEWLGNIFTHYNYTTTDIKQVYNNQERYVRSVQSDFEVTFKEGDKDTPLPSGSPFPHWKAARRFAGPLPFTFTYFPDKKEMLIVEGVRQNWVPQPIEVVDYSFSFLHSLNLAKLRLANAFIIKHIPYYWKKGKVETWNK